MIRMIIIDSVILFLLIYALLDIFMSLSDWLSEKLLCEKEKFSHMVVLLDKTQNIERVIRKTVYKTKENGNIVMLYENTSGDKFEIAQKLCCEYEGVVLLSKEEYFRYIEIKQRI